MCYREIFGHWSVSLCGNSSSSSFARVEKPSPLVQRLINLSRHINSNSDFYKLNYLFEAKSTTMISVDSMAWNSSSSHLKQVLETLGTIFGNLKTLEPTRDLV